jgi:hypothetical protein
MPSIGRILYVLGFLFMLLCITDALLVRYAKIDLTGYPYTPMVLGGIGIILVNVARLLPASNDDEPRTNSASQ